MGHNHFISGRWNVICDSCGLKKKSNEVRRRWDGLIVCADSCWEQDHPQKFIKVREDKQTVPFVRPEPTDTFVAVCYIYTRRAYADLGTADCMQADLADFTYSYLSGLASGVVG